MHEWTRYDLRSLASVVKKQIREDVLDVFINHHLPLQERADQLLGEMRKERRGRWFDPAGYTDAFTVSEINMIARYIAEMTDRLRISQDEHLSKLKLLIKAGKLSGDVDMGAERRREKRELDQLYKVIHADIPELIYAYRYDAYASKAPLSHFWHIYQRNKGQKNGQYQQHLDMNETLRRKRDRVERLEFDGGYTNVEVAARFHVLQFEDAVPMTVGYSNFDGQKEAFCRLIKDGSASGYHYAYRNIRKDLYKAAMELEYEPRIYKPLTLLEIIA